MISEEKSPGEKIIFIINPIAGTRQKQIIHDAILKTFPEEQLMKLPQPWSTHPATWG
jgi:hypothetical protein